MPLYTARPRRLSDAVRYAFLASRGDRERAFKLLLAQLDALKSSPDGAAVRDYFAEKCCRQLIHEFARTERVRSAKTRSLYDYPICTSKLLGDATTEDLFTEAAWHDYHSTTNACKTAFFNHLLSSLIQSSQPTVRQALSLADLSAIYDQHIGAAP